MKKLKEIFVRWFNWFFCKDITKESTDSYKKYHEYLEPKITKESSKENKELDNVITKENINTVQEKPKRKRIKKENDLSRTKEKEQKEDGRVVSKGRKKTNGTTRKK
jgi:hypothetical protein|nr:MAG TPA: hypothetical protein [Caudoviricetes sp.]